MDKKGEIVWNRGTQTDGSMEPDDRLPTTGPEAVEYLNQLNIPGQFLEIDRPGSSQLTSGGIVDEDLAQPDNDP